MYVALVCLGLVLIALEIVAARKNRRFASGQPRNSRWVVAYRWQLVLGVPLAILSAFAGYPMSGGGEQYHVAGVPFMVAAFDSAGRDYVGPLSLPFLIVNGLLWLCLPTLFLWIWSLFVKSAVTDV